MKLKLYHAPLSTFCQKVYLALYEKEIKIEKSEVNLMDEAAKAEYRKLYSFGKVPLLVIDEDHKIPESSIIIEFLDTYFEQGTKLIPTDKEMSRRVRFFDRMFDLYLNEPMSTLFFQMMREPEKRNPELLEKCKFHIDTTYQMLDDHLAKIQFVYGDIFTLADCSLLPPLNYAQKIYPFEKFENIKRYFNAHIKRPSFHKMMNDISPALKSLKIG